ncbi:unnamed protein product [Cladocopium goreaui]|uniref:Potassium voltage-gated channel protein eag n=1 Tax=Cladocopium goreaui TaxID=2562237 RepID=A0A9P1DNN4_9DINO|nr:unnamed protein product [Cladocopium goreaui]
MERYDVSVDREPAKVVAQVEETETDVRGDYNIAGSNHNKPAYKKEQKVSGLDVMLYYWDDRDGVAFCGWWFGPKIGGDQAEGPGGGNVGGFRNGTCG